MIKHDLRVMNCDITRLEVDAIVNAAAGGNLRKRPEEKGRRPDRIQPQVLPDRRFGRTWRQGCGRLGFKPWKGGTFQLTIVD